MLKIRTTHYVPKSTRGRSERTKEIKLINSLEEPCLATIRVPNAGARRAGFGFKPTFLYLFHINHIALSDEIQSNQPEVKIILTGKPLANMSVKFITRLRPNMSGSPCPLWYLFRYCYLLKVYLFSDQSKLYCVYNVYNNVHHPVIYWQ